MSENKPENAGQPGNPAAPAAPSQSAVPVTPPASAASPTGSTTSPSGITSPGKSSAEPVTSLPPSPAVQQAGVIQPPNAGATLPADEEAALRSSTDAPESASTVTPADPQSARQRDAAQARSAAAESTVQQESAVHESEERRVHARPTPLDPTVTLVDSEPVSGELITTGTHPTTTVVEEPEVEDVTASTARPSGSPPPGFGAAPDFSASNPPPPNAIPPSAPRYLKHNDSAWTVFGRIIAARARQLFDRAGQRITQRTLRIGVSARIFHPEPGAKGLRGKTLQYLEESIAHWVMSRDVLVFMIPTVGHQGMLHPSNIRLRDYAKHLDGLLLQGGADVSPQSYAEAATSHEWPGDRVRDMYELELLHEFIESGKPVLGVCRGCQLINVAFGGTLYQDIATDVPTAGAHVNENYDQHRHGIHFPDGSTLANMFPGRRDAIVNSIHHQAVKTLGRDLNIEAVSASDGIIEAVRYRRAPFVMGVQWHPEFHRAGGPELLDCTPLLDTFLRVARETRF
ncbi:gamma-glutamyl-gamma-aminobutyrate hydrolase family protein [Paraburkholderia sp. BCC1886]|uniref:gamma-glutamyl-gamma-aminobutyrate hydrolase family protein n=1 Tax=Paraburkholderia sp. BCC1886 TaxID=2562670 RepID=UPI00118261E7|nr:type 1 glutamine amidotransferase [Paraburkholderia sp. BCC1886]